MKVFSQKDTERNLDENYTLRVPSLAINKFDGFRSLWIIRCEWRKSIPFKSSLDNRYVEKKSQTKTLRNIQKKMKNFKFKGFKGYEEVPEFDVLV